MYCEIRLYYVLKKQHLFQSAAFLKCKSYLLCLKFADKILIFAVLERHDCRTISLVQR